ncbi:2OG-Fe(II) oxygenase [Chondromyces apiculatus]|uniref:Fe2OG dioxygenase domain-containing protein n=1 Tax=Chondromyces apiculatus DSM 436 TaxID=1192034 RepID=A0A017SX71_9BACT|nr:2OG-Fe(II) oxygenase [Chondromyces apiculatus]EYF01215.1 Hypothetical protein CAP_8556 [Chondromyces apiculatus DSM 436]
MTASISDLLAQLKAPGTFAARLSAPAEDLDIEVTGVGPLRFPISPTVAGKLRGVARPSPFGLREQTLHDPSVRNTWEIAPSRVKIAARRWKPALAAHLRTLQAELGIPEEREIEAVFDKLLLYEEGQFFKPHQDSEKSDEMVATLVVILPSAYSGGALTVEHRGEKKHFRRLANQNTDLSLLAFYADCYHAVSPIKRGVRVALTYRLSLRNHAQGGRPLTPSDLVDRLTDSIREHFAVPVRRRYSQSEPAPPERLVYLLDHEYTQRSLSWSHLKNGDGVRVAALRTAAERLDGECFLALADVHEVWTCEYDDWEEYGGSFGWDDPEDEADETDEYTLGDLLDSDIALHHWLDAQGKPIEGVPGEVSLAELHLTRPSTDLAPFKSDYEGYQGNYGNTVDRWYHRAAFVTWPRDNTFALKAQASPQWAVDELLALPRGDTAALEAKITALLPHWPRTAGAVEGARFFARLIKLSTRIHDPALAREWLSPLGAHRLQNQAMRRDLVTLVDRHGLPWARDLFSDWAERPHWATPPLASLLTDLCEALCASQRPPCEALSRWLLEREAKTARERCVTALTQQEPWLDLDVFAPGSTHLAHVLAAAAAVSTPEILDDLTTSLLDGDQRFPTAFFVQLSQACVASSPAFRAQLAGSRLHRTCVERLDAVLKAPVRAPDDWTLTHPLPCTCADCKVLSRFLHAPDTEHDWPLNKERRLHIHRMIDGAQLPVLHTTRRQGSPYVLQLRKDASLFSRERAYRAHVKATLSALRALHAR